MPGKESKMIRTLQVYPSEAVVREEVLLALRELFSSRPEAAQVGSEILIELLRIECFLSHGPPPVSQVEAALEALQVEGEVLA
jgi:hypothetical protein